MGFSVEEVQYTKKEKIKWKFKGQSATNTPLKTFFDKKVQKDDNTYIFDFLNMVYDEEFNELTVKGEDIELNAKLNPKNKDARETFKSLNDTNIKDITIFKKLRQYLKSTKDEKNMSITNKIKFLVEVKKVGRQDKELVYTLSQLFYQAGLKRTHNRYVMPLENNVCRTINTNEMLDFIYDVCNIKMLSIDTLDAALSYHRKEIEPSYHKIVTKNGYYDFEDDKFYTKSDREIVINKVSPYEYKEELIGVEAPPILKGFLEQTFQDDLNKINEMLEIFGYYMDDGNPYQLLVSFIGPSRSGKSVAIKLEQKLLNDSSSSVDIFTADFNSKYVQTLIDSNINVIEEIRGVKNVAEVKNYTGQGGLELARIYEESRHYNDLQVPKTIVTTNNFDGLGDVVDTALIERLRCFIEFINRIDDSKKKDPYIHIKIFEEPDSMNWLLTNSIHAYMEVKRNNKRLSAEKSLDEFITMIKQYVHPLEYILNQCFTYDLKKWHQYIDNEQWGCLVTLDIVKECIYKERPEEKLNDHAKVKGLVLKTFNLVDNFYGANDEENDYYEIKYIHDQKNGKQYRFIKGLIRCK